MSELKRMRISKNLTQKEAATLLEMSLRSYKSYENDEAKHGTPKYEYLLDLLEKKVVFDEEHGILTQEQIKSVCKKVFDDYSINYCILFGSYARGTATEQSDVDLLVSTDVTGLRFFGLAERLRDSLQKKVDLLDLSQLTNNTVLLDEILRDGIKIYDSSEK